MEIKLTSHAKERMEKYEVLEDDVINTLLNPDSIIESHTNRRIYQKLLNNHILRIITEESKEIKIVVTLYKARKTRYEI